jgi:hypothetical protein
MPARSDTIAERFEEIAYELNGITYLPHYRNRAIFVSPGYPKHNKTRFTDVELQLRGAKPKTVMLWARGFTGTVSDSNP